MENKITDSLILAYVGDAVYSLYIRESLAKDINNKVRYLHEKGRDIVSARVQAIVARKIAAQLNDNERAVFMRGRNSKSPVPKSATVAEYRAATGLEALIGYLYLDRNEARLKEIMAVAYEAGMQCEAKKNIPVEAAR